MQAGLHLQTLCTGKVNSIAFCEIHVVFHSGFPGVGLQSGLWAYCCCSQGDSHTADCHERSGGCGETWAG